ncbi:MAG: glycosyltransferase [Bacteroidota bacterium]
MKHVCHISVLNPLKHTRIYYKWARSQCEMGQEVTILAQGGRDKTEDEYGVQLWGTGIFHRLSWRRLLFTWWIRAKIKAQPADIYILHSPELLYLGKWLKKKYKAQVVYDVHEDYQANIVAANHYPPWLKRPLAHIVRVLESQSIPWIDAVSYAEKCYDNILNVPPNRKFFIRNTFSFRPVENQMPTIALPDEPFMVFTGTIAYPWGIIETLEIWMKINQVKEIHLVVIGFAPQRAILESIHQKVNEWGLNNRFHLIGGQQYVAYVDILHAIRKCIFGTALYHSQPNILGKVPTKVYEFMALHKPLLYSDALLPILDQVGDIGLHDKGQHGQELWAFFEQWQRPPFPPEQYAWEQDERELHKMHAYLSPPTDEGASLMT